MLPNKEGQDHTADGTDMPQQGMNINSRIASERQLLSDAKQKGKGATFKTFLKLSGPGWLQSGITIGGVSLASSLYLGVLSGFKCLWLQPVVMIFGVVMLSSIAYITLSTGQRPLRIINTHLSPVLGWSWLLATMAANLVWSMPQFALGIAAVQQNLLPGLVGPNVMPDPWGRIIVVSCFLAVCIFITMLYGTGGWGVKIFEITIKAMVSLIVLCFFAVVVKLSVGEDGIDWGQALRGLIPDPRFLFKPAEGFTPHLQAVTESFRGFWTNLIVGQQRDVMISASAATVGINMTFLFPYSMLRKGWDKSFRGLAIFDLSTGLFIPFVLATGFVVMASASQFYTKAAPGFVPDKEGGIVSVEPADNLVGQYKTLLKKRLAFELGDEAVAKLSPEQLQIQTETLPYADRKMAAMLVKRDNFNLANTLVPLTGKFFAQLLFGLGVMGMALGAATVLMTINGLCLCEMLNKPPVGWPQRVGALMVSVGAIGAVFWKQPAPWLAMVTSAFCSILLPIAYVTFLLLMNNRNVLGDSLPRGGRRVVWNILMVLSTAAATFVSIWSLWARIGAWSIVLIIAFVGLVLIFPRRTKTG
ncbi:MAG: divalent metal cation transporter [Phycisphaerae bacterium]|jgi:Mn2+/Fe2+ NRAMP family transporter